MTLKKHSIRIKHWIAAIALLLLLCSAPPVHAQVTVNDPGFTTNSQDIDRQWGLVKANFLDAWSQTTGSASTTVAIIDTGVDFTHQDLQNINVVPGFDFINNKPLVGKMDSDDNGHGTLMAGILGATANNDIGIVGTNWSISIMPIKALNAKGQGDAATVAEGIMWAADHGANIINLSLSGGFADDTALANAITYAFDRNIVIVAAAGNDTQTTGSDLDQNPVYPVCTDNGQNMVIGVTATDQNDMKVSSSNYGHNCVDVSAPGKRILSTINIDPISKAPAPNSYAYADGTSLAAPLVAGEAALLKSLFPNATNTQIRDRIISSADPIDNLNLAQCGGSSCAGLIGAGRINVLAAISTPIVTATILDGDLVETSSSGPVYQIVGGQARLVSPFVYNQRFLNSSIKIITQSQLESFPQGAYDLPVDGTLVKSAASPAVYIISQGLKQPVTYQIFLQRNFSFANVNTVTDAELQSWLTGKFLPPVDGTLIKSSTNKTVYWVVSGSLHPINYGFYTQRGLNIFPIMVVNNTDIAGFSIGEAYIR